VDDIILFRPLGEAELIRIVDLRLADLRKLLADRRISIELTPAAKELIFMEGYDRAYGARPLKRAIQRMVQDPLAMKILDGEVLHGDHVVTDADVKHRSLKFRVEHAKRAQRSERLETVESPS
jgi:ATP-dependent Clp protease ATP-binding subunit ClpB